MARLEKLAQSCSSDRNILGETRHFLIRFSILSTEECHTCHYFGDQEPIGRQDIGTMAPPNFIMFLDGHNTKMTM